MTKLFGQADADLYTVYHDTYPMRPHYATPEFNYNICHILNHNNLFSGAYAAQAAQMIKQVLSEIRQSQDKLETIK